MSNNYAYTLISFSIIYNIKFKLNRHIDANILMFILFYYTIINKIAINL
jgi:hypothetical protein